MSPDQEYYIHIVEGLTLGQSLEVVVMYPHNLVVCPCGGVRDDVGKELIASLVGPPLRWLELVGHQLGVENRPQDSLAEGEPLSSELVVHEDDDAVKLVLQALGDRWTVVRRHVVQQHAEPNEFKLFVWA